MEFSSRDKSFSRISTSRSQCENIRTPNVHFALTIHIFPNYGENEIEILSSDTSFIAYYTFRHVQSLLVNVTIMRLHPISARQKYFASCWHLAFIDLIFNSVTFIFNYEFPSPIFFHREKYILKASNFFEIFLRYFGNIFKYFLTYMSYYTFICLALRFKLPHEFSSTRIFPVN